MMDNPPRYLGGRCFLPQAASPCHDSGHGFV